MKAFSIPYETVVEFEGRVLVLKKIEGYNYLCLDSKDNVVSIPTMSEVKVLDRLKEV